MKRLRLYTRLCRVPLSLFAALSAAAGFLLASHSYLRALLPMSAVFLLACGASALNQWQERDVDARMERTRSRPLPSGRMSAGEALTVAVFCIAGGLGVSLMTGSMTAAGLGIFAVLWYNGLYTGLKRVTAFAAVPGAVVGMVPPAIGWVAAGGMVMDQRLLIVSFLFFLWQVPHFWLQVLRHGREYEQAGLPSLTQVLTRRQIARITFTWICATAVAGLLLPLFGSVQSPYVYFSFVPLAGWLVWNGRSLIGKRSAVPPSPALFRSINIYLFFIMLLLSADNTLLRAL